MSRTISVRCSSQGMEQAADWLDDYAKRILPKNVVALVSQMTRQGESWAINNLGHIDTGNTLSTIHGYRNGDRGVIVANGAAIWIEFGTGVARNFGTAPHPKAAELGIKPWGTYGEGHGASFNGWYYPDPNGTHQYTDENGVTQAYSHTLGIPANHFMYNTAQELRRSCPEMAREVFSK